MSPGAQWRLVARKELADLLGRVGRRPLTRTLGVVAVFGILVPLRFGGAANLPAFFAVFMAFLPTRLVAIDAFAGERERGTLESLLASPLSDRAIAVGKIAAAAVYGGVRGLLFLAVWLPSAALLRVSGLVPDAPLPGLWVLVAAIAAIAVVSLAAAIFGVWQSSVAPSVRAIVESGGLLRLVVIVSVFFVGPWLLGLMSPDGSAPVVGVGSQTLSLEAVRTAVATSPGTALGIAVAAAVVAAILLAQLTVATLRRCRRERLALVDADVVGRLRAFGRRRDGQDQAQGAVSAE